MRIHTTKSLMDDPERAWAAFQPDRSRPWDLEAVSHLHRRAAFAAPWSVLERDLKDGPDASIKRLLDGESTAGDGTPAAEFATFLGAMAARLGPTAELEGLQAIWLYRMIFSPHPLRERMTLFWHNHFATSIAKVKNSALMQRQNDLLRAQALGDFRGLLRAIGKDPAMLIWLDSTVNKKAHPNENYAREVMELFSLGRGHYSEKDVQEAARAFTGWFVIQDEFSVVPRQHDDGPKTVLGRTGSWSGDDIPAILVEQPACADWICRKLFRYFVSESHPPSEALIAPLARAFRESDCQARVPVAMILHSNLFFDPIMRRRRVKCPVEFAVGTVRSLEILRPTVAPAALARACVQMGQSLYEPPSVAGWEWGRTWINSTTMLARTNLALALLSDDDEAMGHRCDPAKLAARHGFRRPEEAARFLIHLLVPGTVEPSVKESILKAAAAKSADGDSAARDAARRILNLPEYQLA
jgi:uncharacterized protein (DUF1800 family)